MKAEMWSRSSHPTVVFQGSGEVGIRDTFKTWWGSWKAFSITKRVKMRARRKGSNYQLAAPKILFPLSARSRLICWLCSWFPPQISWNMYTNRHPSELLAPSNVCCHFDGWTSRTWKDSSTEILSSDPKAHCSSFVSVCTTGIQQPVSRTKIQLQCWITYNDCKFGLCDHNYCLAREILPVMDYPTPGSMCRGKIVRMQ